MSSGATDQSILPLLLLRRRRASKGGLVEVRDEDLLLRLENGDYSCVDPLFERYAALLFGVAYRILHDRGEAEDLVQDIFLHLCEKVRGFDPGRGSARTWIVQIAYRRAFDRRAYLQRRKFYDGTDVEPLTNNLVGAAAFPVDDLLDAEKLRAAFGELSVKQRTTLELFFFDGLELREISVRLNETLENTRHYYYRGLERLRRGLISPQDGQLCNRK